MMIIIKHRVAESSFECRMAEGPFWTSSFAVSQLRIRPLIFSCQGMFLQYI